MADDEPTDAPLANSPAVPLRQMLRRQQGRWREERLAFEEETRRTIEAVLGCSIEDLAEHETGLGRPTPTALALEGPPYWFSWQWDLGVIRHGGHAALGVARVFPLVGTEQEWLITRTEGPSAGDGYIEQKSKWGWWRPTLEADIVARALLPNPKGYDWSGTGPGVRFGTGWSTHAEGPFGVRLYTRTPEERIAESLAQLVTLLQPPQTDARAT